MILLKHILFVNEFKPFVSPYVLYVGSIFVQEKSSSTLSSIKTFRRVATKSIDVLLSWKQQYNC